MGRILVVEDDKMLNNGICFNLQADGFETIATFSIKEAEEVLKKTSIDMAILDVNLPDGSGFELCKKIRGNEEIGIIFLTACDMEFDVVTGFKLGADDYITKPFSLSILRERVLAVFRRYKKSNKVSNTMVIDELKFDFDKMTVSKNGGNIILTPIEYKLLNALVKGRGQVLTRGVLLEALWDKECDFVDEHTLTVNINRLRSKIEDDPSKPKYVKTVYGIGYMWTGDER
ncbi:response regulator transcription factor [uncultured Clostridium sp.]|uniref:response regulator transcription factor n=1 Tax=uncultured Clostridium sp. TaxID=59620 RepID=UPI0028EAA2E0|nr:response regulator transcription factor [uncultured Clostridium sp.]